MMKLLSKVKMILTSTVLGKIQMAFGKLREFPQALAKKAADCMKAPFKLAFGKPSSIEDYIPVSSVYISKKLVFAVAVGAFAALILIKKYAIPYLEGRLWIPSIVINTPKFHTYVGKAKVVSEDGSLIYAGSLENGEITGYGLLYNGDELAYDGAFGQNDFNGQGKLYYRGGGMLFEGVFEKGEYVNGTLYFQDGTPQFEGSFESGLYKEGRLYHDNGSLKYEGIFKDGQYSEGALYLESGIPLYTGTFLNGSYDGNGNLYSNGRLLYEGEFVNGAYNGLGKLYERGYLKYDGGFSNNVYDGYGKLYLSAERLLYDGDFSGGHYEGGGTLYYQNGKREKYTGSFSDGLFHGEGVLYDEQGRALFAGEFFKGEIDYEAFTNSEVEAIREAFGAERSLEMLENTFILRYSGLNVIFEFSFADEAGPPQAQKIKLLGGQRINGVRNGMPMEEFKKLFGSEIFTEYYFEINSEDEIFLSYAESGLSEGEEAYCVKYDFESVYIRAFSENDKGNIIYYEIGGVG